MFSHRFYVAGEHFHQILNTLMTLISNILLNNYILEEFKDKADTR
jgi:hypothetical protein